MCLFTPELSHKRWRWFAPVYAVESALCHPYTPWTIGTPDLFPAQLVEFNSQPKPVFMQNYRLSQSDFQLPGRPLALQDGQTSPILELLIAKDLGLLQINAQWRLTTETLAAIDALIASIENQNSGSHALWMFSRVELWLNDGQSDRLLATSATSGAPDFTTRFSLALNEEECNLVAGAIRGQSGILRLCYEISSTASSTSAAGSKYADRSTPIHNAQTIYSERNSVVCSCVTDIATWFWKGDGAQCVRVVG